MSGARVSIGAYCSLADGVRFDLTGGGRILVGSDVWIGRGAIVCAGVCIGDGAIVGARAVVTRDVRPYALVAGDPAREVRRRFSDEQVDALLAIRWWEWPAQRIRTHLALLCSPDLDAFLSVASRGSRLTESGCDLRGGA